MTDMEWQYLIILTLQQQCCHMSGLKLCHQKGKIHESNNLLVKMRRMDDFSLKRVLKLNWQPPQKVPKWRKSAPYGNSIKQLNKFVHKLWRSPHEIAVNFEDNPIKNYKKMPKIDFFFWLNLEESLDLSPFLRVRFVVTHVLNS